MAIDRIFPLVRPILYDPKSKPEDPRWFMVDVTFVEKFPRFVALDEIRATPALADMPVIRRGMRLSVQPVTTAQFDVICRLGRRRGRSRTTGTRP